MKTRMLALVTALLTSAAATPQALATGSCGDILTTHTTLDADLTCAGDGLVIGADGITLDCAGHSIRGIVPTNTAGVRIADHAAVTIRRCTISGFDRAVWAERAMDLTFVDNVVSDNRTAVKFDATDRIRVESNRFERQRFPINFRNSTNPRLTNNIFLPGSINGHVGSSVSFLECTNAVATDNRFLGPGSIGVRALGTSAVIERNKFGGMPSRVGVVQANACRVADNSFGPTPGPLAGSGVLISLSDSRDCLVASNRASVRVNTGIFVSVDVAGSGDGNVIVDNEFDDVGVGIALFGSSDSLVRRNRLKSQIGIVVFSPTNDDGSTVVAAERNRIERNDIVASELGIEVADATSNTFERNAISGARYGILDLALTPASTTSNVFRQNEISDSGLFGMIAWGAAPVISGNRFARNGSGPVPHGAADAALQAVPSDLRGGLLLLPFSGSGNSPLDDGDPANDRLASPTIGGQRGIEANVFSDNGDVDILMVDTRATNASTLSDDNRFRHTPIRIRQDWLALVRVEDEQGAPVARAEVVVRDARGQEADHWTTDGNGIAPPGCDPSTSQGLLDGDAGGPVPPWASVTEYTIDRNGRFRLATPHRITAWTIDASGRANYSWNGVADPSDDGSAIDGRYQTARVVVHPGRPCD